MKLKLILSEFKSTTIEEVDITTFNYFGNTDYYDHNDPKSFNVITFKLEKHNTLSDSANADIVFEQLKSQFNLNTDYVKVETYLQMKTEFEDYESDKRPKIIIYFRNGSKGLVNPPYFSFAE